MLLEAISIAAMKDLSIKVLVIVIFLNIILHGFNVPYLCGFQPIHSEIGHVKVMEYEEGEIHSLDGAPSTGALQGSGASSTSSSPYQNIPEPTTTNIRAVLPNTEEGDVGYPNSDLYDFITNDVHLDESDIDISVFDQALEFDPYASYPENSEGVIDSNIIPEYAQLTICNNETAFDSVEPEQEANENQADDSVKEGHNIAIPGKSSGDNKIHSDTEAIVHLLTNIEIGTGELLFSSGSDPILINHDDDDDTREKSEKNVVDIVAANTSQAPDDTKLPETDCLASQPEVKPACKKWKKIDRPYKDNELFADAMKQLRRDINRSTPPDYILSCFNISEPLNKREEYNNELMSNAFEIFLDNSGNSVLLHEEVVNKNPEPWSLLNWPNEPSHQKIENGFSAPFDSSSSSLSNYSSTPYPIDETHPPQSDSFSTPAKLLNCTIPPNKPPQKPAVTPKPPPFRPGPKRSKSLPCSFVPSKPKPRPKPTFPRPPPRPPRPPQPTRPEFKSCLPVPTWSKSLPTKPKPQPHPPKPTFPRPKPRPTRPRKPSASIKPRPRAPPPPILPAGPIRPQCIPRPSAPTKPIPIPQPRPSQRVPKRVPGPSAPAKNTSRLLPRPIAPRPTPCSRKPMGQKEELQDVNVIILTQSSTSQSAAPGSAENDQGTIRCMDTTANNIPPLVPFLTSFGNKPTPPKRPIPSAPKPPRKPKPTGACQMTPAPSGPKEKTNDELKGKQATIHCMDTKVIPPAPFLTTSFLVEHSGKPSPPARPQPSAPKPPHKPKPPGACQMTPAPSSPEEETNDELKGKHAVNKQATIHRMDSKIANKVTPPAPFLKTSFLVEHSGEPSPPARPKPSAPKPPHKPKPPGACQMTPAPSGQEEKTNDELKGKHAINEQATIHHMGAKTANKVVTPVPFLKTSFLVEYSGEPTTSQQEKTDELQDKKTQLAAPLMMAPLPPKPTKYHYPTKTRPEPKPHILPFLTRCRKIISCNQLKQPEVQAISPTGTSESSSTSPRPTCPSPATSSKSHSPEQADKNSGTDQALGKVAPILQSNLSSVALSPRPKLMPQNYMTRTFKPKIPLGMSTSTEQPNTTTMPPMCSLTDPTGLKELPPKYPNPNSKVTGAMGCIRRGIRELFHQDEIIKKPKIDEIEKCIYKTSAYRKFELPRAPPLMQNQDSKERYGPVPCSSTKKEKASLSDAMDVEDLTELTLGLAIYEQKSHL